MAVFDEETERVINEAAQRAVGIYYEKTKDDFDRVIEATDFIKERLDDMPTRDEFNELKDEVSTIRQVVTATNQDVKDHETRITKLENPSFNA